MSKLLPVKMALCSDGGFYPISDDDADVQLPPEVNSELVRDVGSTIIKYMDAATALASGTFAAIRHWIPNHLANPCKLVAVVCPDGIILRFERESGQGSVTTVWSQQSLIDLVPVVSQNVVFCYPGRDFTSLVPTMGMQLTLQKVSVSEPGTVEDIVSLRIGLDAVLERPTEMSEPPSKPFCIASVQNSIVINLLGKLVPSSPGLAKERQTVVRSTVSLPVTWEHLEVYPFVEPGQWKPEYASIWAENDILAAVVAGQFQERYSQTLDPNASARQEWSKRLKSFKELLDSNPEREETLQLYLRDNPIMLCPTQIAQWPKLPLGAKVTDFVFREACGDYLLVEIERSTHELFRQNGDSTSALNHAREQITDWKRYIEDNLGTVQRELNLAGISAQPSGLIVIGRSGSLSVDNRRKLMTMQNMSPRLRIMTYDDVFDNARAVVENLLGPIPDQPGNTQVFYL